MCGPRVGPTLADGAGPVVLDTDIASLTIKGTLDPAPDRLVGRTWCVSFVTVGELVKWAESHRWGLRRWTELADWLGRVVVLPYDVQVAYTWAPARRCGGAPWSFAAGERHVGRGVLPGRGRAAGDAERQGLGGLRRASRLAPRARLARLDTPGPPVGLLLRFPGLRHARRRAGRPQRSEGRTGPASAHRPAVLMIVRRRSRCHHDARHRQFARDTNPAIVAESRHKLDEVLADVRSS